MIYLHQVSILNRVDDKSERIDGLRIYIVNNTENQHCGEVMYFSGDDNAKPIDISCKLNGSRVRMEKDGIVTLCQVILYGYELTGEFFFLQPIIFNIT